MEAYQDNEALWFIPMVMSSPHCFELYSRSNDCISTKTLSQHTFQGSFIYDSQQVYYFPLNPLHQFYDSPDEFYDRIEAWLEG